MTTITMPKVGDRLRAVCIPHVTHDGDTATSPAQDRYILTTLEFTVARISEPLNRVYGEFTYHRRGADPSRTYNEHWYVTEWEPIDTLPNIGDKVYPLPDADGSWLSIPDYYHDKVGTVVTASESASGVTTISAEFQSHTKPDDTINWTFHNWKPAPADEPITFETRERLIGRRIKAIHANSSVNIGQEYTVTGTFYQREGRYDQKIDGITLNVGPNGDESSYWVQAYEVLPDEKTPTPPPFREGETLIVHSRSDVYDGREVTYINVDGGAGRHAVRLDGETLYFYERHLKRPDAYVPAVGDRVRFTGCLNEDGIEDGFEREGTITAVTGNIWEIDGILGGKYVSGPGYVFPFPVEAEIVPAPRQEEIDRLTRELEQARENNRILMKSVEDWTHDFDLYAGEVMNEAVQRDWCEEYERVIGRIESNLLVGSIPERTKPRVQVYRRIRGTVYTDVRVWVDEDNQYTTDTDEIYAEKDDEEAVGDDWAADNIQNEVDNNGFDDIEVETR
jgi:hypothetical protein